MAKRGFTLVELIITIGVMAVLAAGTMSLIGPGAARSGRDSRRQADLQSVSSALAMYRNDEGEYPLCSSGSSCYLSGVQGLVTTYLQALPIDPRSPARQYRYRPLSSADGVCDNGATRCAKYRLCAGSERDTSPDNSTNCGGDCGSGMICVFMVTSQ